MIVLRVRHHIRHLRDRIATNSDIVSPISVEYEQEMNVCNLSRRCLDSMALGMGPSAPILASELLTTPAIDRRNHKI